MAKPAYKRVLLKLSGEFMASDNGFGVDPTTAEQLANRSSCRRRSVWT